MFQITDQTLKVSLRLIATKALRKAHHVFCPWKEHRLLEYCMMRTREMRLLLCFRRHLVLSESSEI